MKAVQLITLFTTTASAWTFSYSGGVRDGKGDRGCTGINHPKGAEFDWSNAWYSSCCLHLYDSSSCSNQVGYSCDDWKKKASQPIKGYKITDC
jgi:hypothetical protein